MKKITILAFLLSITIGFSQQQTYNVTFESGSTVGTWTTFENNDGDNALEILANPVSGGINTSLTVAKFTAKSTANGGQPWAGTQSDHGSLGTWLLETGNNSISITVYKPVISDVGIKFVNATNGTIFELKKPNTTINTWETITFDISGSIGSGENHDIDRLVVFPDWPATRAQDNICYFDNVTWAAKKTAEPGASASVDAPLVAAPTPSPVQADVISLFSDSYTNVAVSTWRTVWSGAGAQTDISVVGNAVKKYESVDFVGIEFTGANAIDATGKQFFHVDVWTPDATLFRVKLVDLGASKEGEIAFTPTQSGWVSLDIPMADFADASKVTNSNKLLTSVNSLQQLIFSGQPTGTFNFYIDNVYFSNVASSSTLAIDDFKILGLSVYPNPTNNHWVISSKNDKITAVEVYDLLGRNVISLTPNKQEVSIDASNLATGIYLSKIITSKGTSSKKLIKN